MIADTVVVLMYVLALWLVWRSVTVPEARCGSELPPAAPPVVGPTALRTPEQFDREILDYMRSKLSEGQRDQQWQRIAKAKADAEAEAERSRDEFEDRMRRMFADMSAAQRAYDESHFTRQPIFPGRITNPKRYETVDEFLADEHRGSRA